MALEGSDRRFFTTSEVARYCAVTNDGVLKWIKAGKLKAFSTPGGHYRIASDEFRGFLQRYEIPVDETFFRAPDRDRSVLLVDTDTDLRELVRRVLAQVAVELRMEQAADGYEAGIKIGTLQPDLVIVDVTTSRVDGLSLCRSIRENPETRHIKVLAVTGFPGQDHLKKMYDAGADLCLMKPLQFDHVRVEVSRLLEDGSASHVA